MATRTRTPRAKKTGTASATMPVSIHNEEASNATLPPLEKGLTIPVLPGMDEVKAVALAKSITALLSEVDSKVKEAAGYDILDNSGFEAADRTLGEVADLSRSIENALQPYIEFLRVPLDQLYAIKRTILKPLSGDGGAESLLKSKMSIFRLEEKGRKDREAAADLQRAQEMSARVQEQVPQPLAVPLPQLPTATATQPMMYADPHYGVPQSANQYAYIQPPSLQPPPSPPPPAPPPLPLPLQQPATPLISVAPITFHAPTAQAQHSTTSYVTRIKVVDVESLIYSVVAGLAPFSLLGAIQSELNAWLDNNPQQARMCPGVEVYEDAQIGRR